MVNTNTCVMPAENLQILALLGLAENGSKTNAILAVEELTRRAQVEEQRQAAENAARRALGEERG